jgi:hypothetical protein|tara:strand:- start:167 stop:343 length:177 start_codon:yes stop_codon:yes gene_type:complete
MEGEIKNFKADLLKLAWFMRGSVTLDEMYATCHEDREVMSTVIKDNLDTAKKTGQPFF